MPSWRDDQVKYQNDLINQRLTWLGVFEGLLFVASSSPDHPYLIPLAGLIVAISVAVGTYHANRVLKALDAQAYTDWRRWLMPGTAIPFVIAVAWIAILVGEIRKHWCHAIGEPFGL